jgi:hypothetical protein
LADLAAIGRLNLCASRRLFFIGVFCRILDFLTSLFDLLPGFFYRLIDLPSGALRGALFFSGSRIALRSEHSLLVPP